MNPLPLAAALLTAGTMAFAGETRSYDLAGFDAIKAGSGVYVTVTEGQTFNITAEAVRGNLRRLRIEQQGDTLVIERERSFRLFGVGRRDRFEVTVTLPDLKNAHAASGSSMTIAGAGHGDLTLKSSSGASLIIEGSIHGDLHADASSGASLNASGFAADALVVEASSGATLRLDGSCTTITADASSGASLHAKDATCVKGDATASGGASLNIYASDTLSAKGSGGATINVYGDPYVQSQASGGATVRVN